jgi:hypothetical protein
MAELSYRDVQRAVQESIRNLQETVQRLTSNMGSVTSTRADHIAYIEVAIRDLQNTTKLMQQNLNTMMITSNADPRMAQLCRDVYELKVRFTNIERYIQQSGEYLQNKLAEEAEDQNYRNA